MSELKLHEIKKRPYVSYLINYSYLDEELSFSDKINLIEYSTELIEQIKDPEKKIQYYHKILDVDENAKSFVYFQAAKYFDKENDEKNKKYYLDQAFEALKEKKDMIIKKEDIYEMAYIFIDDYNEIDKGLDCSQLVNELEREKGKNLFKDYLKGMGK